MSTPRWAFDWMLLLVVAALLFALGYRAWRDRPTRDVNRWFAFQTLAVGAWATGVAALHHGVWMEFWGAWTFASAALLPLALLRFTRVFPHRWPDVTPWLWAAMTQALAHEIANPISPIKTMTRLLEQKAQDRAFIENFQRIVSRELDRIEQERDRGDRGRARRSSRGGGHRQARGRCRRPRHGHGDGFSRRRDRRGASVAQRGGGRIEVANRAQGGGIVTLRLPGGAPGGPSTRT